jgi:hypothetical protein
MRFNISFTFFTNYMEDISSHARNQPHQKNMDTSHIRRTWTPATSEEHGHQPHQKNMVARSHTDSYSEQIF